MTRRSVVTGVRDTPRVVRDEEERVEEESDRVVDGFRRRESLVTTCDTRKAGRQPNNGKRDTKLRPYIRDL